MANELLRRAIAQSGRDLDEIADIAGVDQKTVRRWLTGRNPHPRHRIKVAGALGIDEQELWPDTRRATGREGGSEIIAAYPRRSDPDAPDWQALLQTAEQHVDMLGYSLLHVAERRAINKLLAAKANAGCQIRIAIADPTSQAVLAADAAQRPSGRLTARIENSRERFRPLITQAGIEVRQHRVATSHTILRFDDHLLLTVHLHGTPGFQAPLLHLRREGDYGLFDQFAKHVEDVWQTAEPIGLQRGERSPAGAAPVSAGDASNALDELDYVWRPSPSPDRPPSAR